MSSTLTPHPPNESLLRLVDDDLPAPERQMVERHLGACGACRRELEEVRQALQDYLQFHESVLKTALPPAPSEWERLDRLAAEMPARARRARLLSWAPRGWLAAAAAIAAVFLMVRLVNQAPRVSAAELLHKAVLAEKASPARARSIRIKTRTLKWDRPARIRENAAQVAGDASAIRRLLESAGYGWEDPLSADAYGRWHDHLARKRDWVEAVSGVSVIHTTTEANPISDASLTLNGLHAVACTLRFGTSETLEMTEIQGAEPAVAESTPAPGAPTILPPPSTVVDRVAGPGEELQVIAALHRIGADLGEPIDVKREGANMVVRMTGLGAQREADVRTALAGLAAVQLQVGKFENLEGRESPRHPAVQVDTANPLLDELRAASPDGATAAEMADQLTDHTESILERVYALRGLARRFPSEVTARMSPSELAAMDGIVRDHAGAIAAARSAIERLVKPILPGRGPAPPVPATTWQEAAQALVDDARRLDEALNAATASGELRERKLRAEEALAHMERFLPRLHVPSQR